MSKRHHQLMPVLAGHSKVATAKPCKSASCAQSGCCQDKLAEAIRVLAYHKWEQAGRPEGDGVSFWIAAEKERLQGE